MNISWKQIARYFIVLIGVAVLLVRLFHNNNNHYNPSNQIPKNDTPPPVESVKHKTSDSPVDQPTTVNKDIPDYVIKVLDHVLKNHHALPEYVGGRIFDNREQVLNVYDRAGERIQYQEWDVHPKVRGQNRGAERLITGSDHSAYYTSNHYQTFIKIKL